MGRDNIKPHLKIGEKNMEENNNNGFYYGETPDYTSGDQNSGFFNSILNGLFETGDGGREENVFSRWLHPEIAEQKEFERENYLMDKGNAFNEYMFNKANEWNSASAQMQRAKEAGINPMLAAAGISGVNATPMQSQSAGVGMNQNSPNPLDLMNAIFNGLDTATSTADKLGKLFGFGKENKANINLANRTAEKVGTEIGLNKHNLVRLKKSFKSFIRETEANANIAEQNFKNLQVLYDKYKAEKELIDKQKDLVTEQENTQKEITKQEELKKWEMQFKKHFRDLFGVQLNESDTSMLAQLVLNGHGQEILDAIGDMFSSITKSNVVNNFKNWWDENTKNNEERSRKHYAKNVAEGNWLRMGYKERRKWESKEAYINWQIGKIYDKKGWR